MLISAHSSELIEAGCDEAGRGCLAGPVYAAAVILPKKFDIKGLNDSKKLKHQKRLELRHQIESQAISFAVSSIDHETIDKINILNASILAMHEALEQLRPQPELILVDGNRFKPYPFVSHQCVVGGDAKYASIAAASILAKTYRDEYMLGLAKEFPNYDWENNKGYGTKKHLIALKTLGPCNYHRASFKVDLSKV